MVARQGTLHPAVPARAGAGADVGDDHVHVTAVGSADAALAALDERQFDCMVLDLKLPKMSGFEVCKRLKADTATRDIADMGGIKVALLNGAQDAGEDFLRMSAASGAKSRASDVIAGSMSTSAVRRAHSSNRGSIA